MKSLRVLLALAIVILIAYPVIAHHPAESVVDAEIYAMIDALVADTPHATMDLTTMGADLTGRVQDVEQLVEDGFLGMVSSLDGDVTMTLEFDGYKSVTMTIIQENVPVDQEKSDPDVDNTSLGDLKASFR